MSRSGSSAAQAGGARLFVALDPPATVREQLAWWGRQARRSAGSQLRVVGMEHLHVTLCFLGTRPFADIDAVAPTLTTCASAVTRLAIGAPLWLPPRRPRVLAVEIHDQAGELAALQAAVALSLAQEIDWEPEQRHYRPHITVGRMSAAAGPRGALLLDPTPAVQFGGEALTLYRSWLAPEGATYEALSSIAL